MWFGVVSLFPEMFQALEAGITGFAMQEGLLTIQHWNPRDFATDRRLSVDDSPYGGGPGMVMLAHPLQAALEAAKKAAKKPPTVVYLSPQGKRFDQAAAMAFAAQQSVVLLAGRYEGIDQRIIEQEVDEEWSIGDYVLTGGELAAMVMIDAITRFIPGAVGHAHSVSQDSLANGLLKYPQYTRPENFQGKCVPDVLLSGHHEQIATWRLKQSLGRTWLRRPDLLAKKILTEHETALLNEFINEFLQ